MLCKASYRQALLEVYQGGSTNNKTKMKIYKWFCSELEKTKNHTFFWVIVSFLLFLVVTFVADMLLAAWIQDWIGRIVYYCISVPIYFIAGIFGIQPRMF